MTENKQSFEQAFEKLEEILENMNSGKLSLDEALKLFEEGDQLISNCSSKLSKAEQKIETLIKNRQKELSLDENKEPLKETFEPEGSKVL